MTEQQLMEILNAIATKNMLVRHDLETRNHDSSDFREAAVWNVRDALIEAYELGKKEAQ